MIKNDKVLPFIFIKRQKAEQNNLLSSSARFICLAKPGGGRKGGWKAVATRCPPATPQFVPPWEEMRAVLLQNTFPKLRSSAMPVQLGGSRFCCVPKKCRQSVPSPFNKPRSQVLFSQVILWVTLL